MYTISDEKLYIQFEVFVLIMAQLAWLNDYIYIYHLFIIIHSKVYCAVYINVYGQWQHNINIILEKIYL